MKKIIFSIVCLLIGLGSLNAQESGDKLKALLDKQEYVFVATSVFPQGDAATQRILNRLSQGGGNQLTQLSAGYDVKVSKTTVESFLPYFGRAFSAPMNPNEGGIKFKSEDFEYSRKQKKKKGWDIVIKPKDVSDINYLNLSVSESGYANLLVVSNQKSQISFYGYITAPENKK